MGKRSALLFVAVVAGACSAETVTPPARPTTPKEQRPQRTPGPMADVHATRMGEKLAAAGLDAYKKPWRTEHRTRAGR